MTGTPVPAAKAINTHTPGKQAMSDLLSLAPGASLPDDPEQLRLLARQALGVTQGTRMLSMLGLAAEAKLLREIKERKLYELEGHTWESYCTQMVGRARRTVDEDIQNLETFGEEFVRMADLMSIGRRTLRSLRSIPEDARPRLLSSGEIELGDRRVPVTAEHKAEIAELLEDILAGQQQLREQIEQGSQMLSERDVAVAQLQRKVKELEVGSQARVATPLEEAFARSFLYLRRAADIIADEQTAPAEVLKWVRQLNPVLSELTRYGGQMADVDVSGEFDAAALNEAFHDIDEADRA